ncbi:TPA: hypothetical protein N0F65_002156, partial [Lagenidium giganteum]
RQKTRKGGITSQDAVWIRETFIEEVQAIINEHNPARIINADQTAVQFEIISKTTVDQRGAETVWVNTGGKDKVAKATPAFKPAVQQEKDRLRHGFGSRVWKEISAIQRNGRSDLREQVGMVDIRSV